MTWDDFPLIVTDMTFKKWQQCDVYDYIDLIEELELGKI